MKRNCWTLHPQGKKWCVKMGKTYRNDKQGATFILHQLFIRLFMMRQTNELCNKAFGMSTDDASVIGIRNGVVLIIKGDVPHFISLQWIAHRLELGIKDSIKQVGYLTKVGYLLYLYLIFI